MTRADDRHDELSAGATRDTAWTMVTYIARAVASLAFVVSTSRALGAGTYGSLAALSSLTSLGVALFVSGFSRAVTQTAAQRSHDPDTTVGAALRGIGTACVVTVLPFALLASLLPRVTVLGAASLYLVDVGLTGATEAVASRWVGEGRFRISTALLTPLALGRAGAAVVVLAAGIDTLTGVCVTALAAGAIAFVIAALVHRATRGSADQAAPTARQLARTGAVYTAGNLVNRASNDLDKVYLSASLAGDPRVGSYAIASRLVEYAGIPMVALSAALSPRLFKAGLDGEDAAHHAGRRLRTRYLVTGAATSVAIVIAAPLAHLLFGDGYVRLAALMLAFAPLPLIRSFSNSLAEPFTGAGRHHVRVRVWILGLIVNVAMNVVLVPMAGVTGALIATYGTELSQIAAFSRLRARPTINDRTSPPTDAPR